MQTLQAQGGSEDELHRIAGTGDLVPPSSWNQACFDRQWGERTRAEALDEAEIPYVPAVGAMSVWVDLRAALTDKTWEAERKIWNDLVEDHRVVLTPGAHP